MKRKTTPREDLAGYYDRHRVLGEIDDRHVEFALDDELRRQIRSGATAPRLQNLSLKLDPAHVIALRKIAVMKAIPYQTLIRQGLAEGIRRELRLTAR